MCNFLLGDDFPFGEDFHRIYALRVLFPNLEDLSERTPTNELEKLKVSWGERASRLKVEYRGDQSRRRYMQCGMERCGARWECENVSGRSGVEHVKSVGMSGRRMYQKWVDTYLASFERYLHSDFTCDGFVVIRFQPRE